MKHRIYRIPASALCALVLLLCLLPATASAADTYMDSGSTSLTKLSKEEIAELTAIQPIASSNAPYQSAPSVSQPYAAGSLKQEVLQAGLDRLNALRRIAGQQPAQPSTPATPTTPTTPTNPTTPATGGKLTIENCMLAAPTFGWNTALKTDGTIWTWDNQNTTPTLKSGIKGKSASAYACIAEDDSLWIWGFKAYQNGSSDYSMDPTPVKVMDNVLYAGINDSGYVSALKTDGSLWRWGSGKAPSSAVKVLDDVVQIANPGSGWYALKKDGTLWYAYGYDAEDIEQIGSGYKAFGTGDWGNTIYGIKADGSLWGWGYNDEAQLGQGYVSDYQETPVKIMDDVVAIDGRFAITSDGTLYAWGRNSNNWLGFSGGDLRIDDDGASVVCQSTPRKVMDGVAAVRDSTVLKQDGSLWNLSFNDSTNSYGSFQKILDGVKLPGTDSSTPSKPDTPTQPTVEAGEETPTPGGNDGAAYSKRSGNLGPRPDGGCDLIWTSGNKTYMNNKLVSDTRQTKITSYDKDFNEIAVHPIQFELETLKGAYWGEKYNYLIFTQNNDEETDNKEVLRLVKFSKDWKRLGAASLYGKSSNTSEAVRAANLSFAECGDMLYIHTAHKMYRSRDGLQHQAGMTFSVRQSDMSITDGRYGVEMADRGYSSHSFAQDILVDKAGNIVTLDLGDAYPRAAMLFKYGAKAGGDRFTSTGTYVMLQKWSGATGDNNTGSKTCALAETSQGYLSAYLDSGKGAGYNNNQDYYNVYLAFNPKNNFTKTQTYQVAAGNASENPAYVYLFPTGPEGGRILWFSSQKGEYSWMSDYTAYCATYSADGSVGSATKLTSFSGAPFNGPYYDGSRIVWSDQADGEKGMNFYILDSSGLTVTKAGGELAGKAETTTPATPTTPTNPTGGSTPFTDVPAGAYYTDAVAWALEKGVTAGTTATTFSPYATCTRGQVATFLWRAKGEPEPVTRNNPFRDVKASDYYYKAVLWAYENGITAGTSATTFGPNNTCTNSHVVTFLWRANGEPAASGTSTLAGSFPRDFYTDAVAWADTSGLLKDTGTAFDPRSQSPRANIVTYLYRNLAK